MDKLFLVDVKHNAKQRIIRRYDSKMHRFIFYKLAQTSNCAAAYKK